MSFGGLLNQQIQVHAKGTVQDKQGHFLFGDPTTHRARVERTAEVIILPDKQVVPIDAIIFIDGGAAIEEGVRLVYNDEVFKVMRFHSAVGRAGKIHHYEIKAQKWCD